MRQIPPPPLDPALLECLVEVIDPEIGLNVVDLGLVYRASQDESGIDIALTLTTRACPLGEMLLEETREQIAGRFEDAPRISVALIWHPPWTPNMITDRGRAQLGHQPSEAA